MASKVWVNIGAGNGLLADGTKPFWTRVDLSSVGLCGICMRAITQEVLQMSTYKISLEIRLNYTFIINVTSPRVQGLNMGSLSLLSLSGRYVCV